MASKAVHLEAVSELSSNAFLDALKRLIGRRGIPSRIICDNATNFVGAASALKQLREQFFKESHINAINHFCSQHFIQFQFIPPRAPHFGGIWEAAVKVAKGHLLKSMGSARLTYEGLSTALIEIEAIMNSRPICAASADPNDLEVITPAHMLTGASLKSIPEPGYKEDDISYLQKWQRISAIKHHFWERWRKEYLHDLQGRSKWTQAKPNIAIGSLVLVHEENEPPLSWLLGRITNVFRGKDDVVRVAEVRTKKGLMKRPIVKLALLPVC